MNEAGDPRNFARIPTLKEHGQARLRILTLGISWEAKI